MAQVNTIRQFVINSLKKFYQRLSEKSLPWESGIGINSAQLKGADALAIGDHSIAEGRGSQEQSSFTVTGEANTTTYTTSTNHGLGIGEVIMYNNVYRRIVSIPSDTSFTVDNTLSPDALNDVNIYKVYGVTYYEDSHSEGYKTIALGDSSHAEGGVTKALSASSHAEGSYTIASGDSSHAEGSNTIAYNDGEHAEGRYNKSIEGKTIHTVGIGESDGKNAHEIHYDGSHYIYDIGGYDGTNSQTEGVKTLQTVVSDKLDKMIDITWADLKTLRDNSKLIPGQKYRITDYETTTIAIDTQSACHPFDIIVTALDVNKLFEVASAIQSVRDTEGYFSNSNLNAWELKYCLDNDRTRFEWISDGEGCIIAGEGPNDGMFEPEGYDYNEPQNQFNYLGTFIYNGQTYYQWTHADDETISVLTTERDYSNNNLKINNNDLSITPKIVAYLRNDETYNTNHNADLTYIVDGNSDCIWIDHFYVISSPPSTGTIYYMKDEYGNECPYDFKNIQFKRYKITSSVKGDLIGKYTISGAYNVTVDGSTSYWCYTFSTDSLDDASLDGYSNGVHNNVISEYVEYRIKFNNIVFIGNDNYGNGFGVNCYNNTFGNACYNNTFGNDCNLNTFGNDCNWNIFGNYFRYNTVGNDCNLNTFGNNCSSNTFGNNCWNNTIGNDCYNNTFGNNCYSNTFGNNWWHNTIGNDCNWNTVGINCGSNTFGNDCTWNTFGNNCYSNTFGDYCDGNTFGNDCGGNTFGNHCYNNTFGNDCLYVKFAANKSVITKYNYYQRNRFGDGCRYIVFTGAETAGGSRQVQNYNFAQGLQGTSNAYLTIDGVRNRSFETKVAKNSNGEVKIYCEADLIM